MIMRKINPMKLLVLIFLLIGIVFTGILGIFMAININIKKNYVPADATIVDFVRNHSGDNTLTVVKYFVDGQEYESSLNSYSSNWSVGDRVNVYYNPENPDETKMEIPVIMMIVFPSFGIVFIAVGLFLCLKEKKLKRKKKKLIENGLSVNAKVIDFTVNTRISVNNRHPFIIIAEYDDSINKHRFRSDNVWENVTSDCIGETVKVYYEPNNMNNYYVDADGLFNETYSVNNNVIYH